MLLQLISTGASIINTSRLQIRDQQELRPFNKNKTDKASVEAWAPVECIIIFRALARPKMSLATVAKLVLNFLATGLTF
jgi:hypothetical protein